MHNISRAVGDVVFTLRSTDQKRLALGKKPANASKENSQDGNALSKLDSTIKSLKESQAAKSRILNEVNARDAAHQAQAMIQAQPEAALLAQANMTSQAIMQLLR